MLPATRPKISREEIEGLINTKFGTPKYNVILVGLRGYYKKSFGNPDTNDIGVYDDALCIISDKVFATYNFNTDPSRQYPGIATLKSGEMYLYSKGIHGMHHLNLKDKHDANLYQQLLETKKDVPELPLTYWAFRQYGNVTVIRNGIPVTDSPQRRFYIDIHRGGVNTTSSEGCQTVPPSQWIEARLTGFTEMSRNNQTVIPYYLLDM